MPMSTRSEYERLTPAQQAALAGIDELAHSRKLGWEEIAVELFQLKNWDLYQQFKAHPELWQEYSLVAAPNHRQSREKTSLR